MTAMVDNKDIVVDQIMDVKILKQLLAGAKDDSTINIIYNPVNIVKQVVQTTPEGINVDCPNGDIKRALLYILDELPEPKMANLRELVYGVVMERFSENMAAGARYLGISRRTLDNRVLEK